MSCCACPEARHAPETRGQPRVGDRPGPRLRLSDAFVSPGATQGRARTFSGSGFGSPSFPEPALPAPRGLRRPRPVPLVTTRLPLGTVQTEPQPLWQHLRFLSQSPSDWHSLLCVQFRSAWGRGHRPGFSAPASRGERGEPQWEQAKDAHLCSKSPKSQRQAVSLSGP